MSRYGDEFLNTFPLSLQKRRTLRAIEQCRTEPLGWHVDACDACGHIRVSYNSCRNRHCPKCQTTQCERWLMGREADLLPVRYFHVVFTQPDTVNGLCLQYPAQMYKMLFEASWETIDAFSRDPKHLGAQLGMTSILHTWGQNLSLHPHLHCIIPSGGVTIRQKWKHARGNGKYLFPVKALSKMFRGKYLEKLKTWLTSEKVPFDSTRMDSLYRKNWVVYAKQPFLGPAQVLEYIGRYTHKVAISNHRIKGIDQGKIEFTYKDYRHGDQQKRMTLDANEFLRRFCLHILPPGFVRIRHYGILSCRNKSIIRRLQGVSPDQTPQKLSWQDICRKRLSFDPDLCPCCGKGRMVTIERVLPSRAPPRFVSGLSV